MFRSASFLLISLLALHATAPGAAQAQQAPQATPVGVVTLAEQDVPVTATLPGRAVAFEQVPIRPQVGGTISEILYQPGRRVDAGTALFHIDDQVFAAEFAVAQAEVARAQAALTAAQATQGRYERLEGSGVTTADLEAARVDVKQKEADLSSAQAALKLAQLDLDRTVIRSPITGIVEVSDIAVGTVVTANQTDALTTVIRIDPIFVDVEESSKRVAEVRAMIASGALQLGAQLQVGLTLENGQSYDRAGELVSPGARVSATTGTTLFRMRFDNPDRQILPGQFLRTEIELGAQRAVLVPQGATRRASNGTLTALIAENGKAVSRTLTESGAWQNQWIVTSGVAPGDRVIVDGLSSLREGADIAPVPVEINADGVVTDLTTTQAQGN